MEKINDIWSFMINDKIIQKEGFKKGRKGVVVEVPYDGDENCNQLGVLWDDNKAIGIQPVSPNTVSKVE